MTQFTPAPLSGPSEVEPVVLDPDISRTVCASLQGGGTAKTTTLVSVGHALTRLGLRVLLIDLDHNMGLTNLLGLDPAGSDPEEPMPTAADVITPRKSKVGTPTITRGQAAGSILMAPDAWQPQHDVPWEKGGAYAAGGQLYVIPGAARIEHVAGEGWRNAGAVSYLQRALSGVASQLDICLIDTHPDMLYATQMAVRASGWVVSPFLPESAAVNGLRAELDFLDAFSEGWEHPVRFMGAICSKYISTYTVAHGRPFAEAQSLLAEREPMTDATRRYTLDSHGRTVHVGGLFPQVIPQSAALLREAWTYGPVSGSRHGRGRVLADLYAQIGLRMLEIIESPVLSGLLDQFAERPLPGVWPPPDDTSPLTLRPGASSKETIE